jgi:Type II secretion system (T2SS), protein E, N-terminal domain
MGNEAATLAIPVLTTSPPTVALVETIQDIVSTAERILSTGHDHLALVTIRLGYATDAQDEQFTPQQSLGTAASTLSLLQDLRPLVRKTDQVLRLGHTLSFLLPGATLQGGHIVQSRLWEALLWRVHHLSERALVRPQAMTIGHSSYPLPHTSLQELMAAADEAHCRFEAHPEQAPRKQATAAHDQQLQEERDQELLMLARKLGIPYLTLLPSTFPQRLQRLINPTLAQELQCFPLGRERNRLTVAMLHPDDHSALDRLKRETGLHIFPVLAPPHALQVALEQFV